MNDKELEKIKKKKKKLKAQKKELNDFLEQVKGAASSADVDVVHNIINQGIKLKLGAQLHSAKLLMEQGKIDEAMFEIDEKAYMMGIRWCQQNNTVKTPEQAREHKEQLSNLKQIQDYQRGRTLRAVGD
jgi:metal-dependent amidase/aminoacylase/carboxypeptidase family protein